jgi:hypothetical protein
MEKEEKNLVRDFLLEQKVIDPDKFVYSYLYYDVEWFVFKLSDESMKYVSYELTPYGIGYAFCVTITCLSHTYDIESVYYSKSFTNDTTGEWVDISDKFKDKLLSETIGYLNIWDKK